MKVLIVSEGIPTEKYPLLGIFALDQAKALAQAGIDVVFFALDLRTIRRKRKLGIRKGDIHGVRWYSINIPVGTFSFAIMLPVGKIALLYLYNQVFKKEDKPDVIHAHFTAMGNIASFLARKKHLPLVVTEHSSAINKTCISQRLKKVAVQAYTYADKVIAVSKALANNIFEHTGVRSVVIPNIIDLNLFSRTNQVKHDYYVLVTTCNLIPIKRVDVLLRALATIVEAKDNIKLMIIGEGIQKEELRKLSVDLGIGNMVSFCGLKTRDEIAKIYCYCDCFIMLSDSETFGVSYVEAMAAGLPVIATRCGGPEGFVNENNGILVDRDDERQVAEVIKKIYFNEITFDKSKIKESTRQFAPEIIAKSIIDIYEEVIL